MGYTFRVLGIVAYCLIAGSASAQFSLSTGTNTINFSGYTGTGFSSGSSVSGSIDSDQWGIDMDNDGAMDVDFGATNTTANPYAGGVQTGTGSEGRIYAYDYGGSRNAFGIRPIQNNLGDPDEFNSAIFRFRNNTGGIITDLAISYDPYFRGNNNKVITVAVEHSSDNTTYTDPGTLDFSIAASVGNTWTAGTSPSATITGLSIGDGDLYYIKWIFEDAENGGSTAVAIDQIDITPTVANPASTSTITAGSVGSSTISSLVVSSSGQQVFDFDYLDDGASPSSDAFNTMISEIVIGEGASDAISDWNDVIAGAQLSDGTTTVTASSIGTNSITFNGFNYSTSGDFGFIADNGTKTYTLSVWLSTSNSEVIDNQLLRFNAQTSGFTYFGASSSLITTETETSSVSNNIIDVDATTWAFQSVPNSVGTSLDFSLTIAATDTHGNTDTDETTSFDLTRNAGTGTLASGTGLTGISLSSGTFNYSDLTYDTDETFSIDVATNTGTSLTGATSSNIIAAEAYRSTGTGNWSNAGSWEFFTGGAWTAASGSPTSTDGPITIQNGHTITFDAAATVDQITVESGATLTLTAGLTLSDVSGEDDLIVEGTLNVQSAITINTGATISVSSGGIITTASDALENDLAGPNSSGEVVYNHGSIFEYTGTNAFDEVTYFPDVTSSVIPTFRITNFTNNLNNFDDFIVNGILEVNSNFGIGNSNNGTLDLRNGLTGSGNLTFSTNTDFNFSGDSVFFGGAGVLDLGANDFAFTSSQVVTMTADKEIQDGTFTFNSGSTFYLSDNFQLNDGTANDLTVTFVSGSNLIAEGSNGLSTGAAGVIDVNSLVFSGSENFEFNGTASQNTNFGSLSITAVNNITINNSAGVVLSEPITVNGTLTLTSGNFTTTSVNIPTMTSSSPFSGGSSSSFIDGPVTMSSFTAAITFPVGDGSDFRQVILDPVSSSTFTVEHFSTTPTNSSSFTTPVQSLLQTRYWTLTRGSGSGDVQVTLYWDETGDSFSGNSNLLLGRYNTGTTSWESMGYDSHTSNTLTATSSTFSDYTVASSESTLPVEMVSFEAKQIDETVELNWLTASELNNDRFEIQRSYDGIEFESIGEIAGNGTTNELTEYIYVDSNPLYGNNYYRLKQIDFDGAYEFSSTLFVSFESSLNRGLAVFPNPLIGDELNIQFEGSFEDEPISISVYDMTGRMVFENQFSSVSTGFTKTLMMSTIPNGNYVLNVNRNGITTNYSIIK